MASFRALSAYAFAPLIILRISAFSYAYFNYSCAFSFIYLAFSAAASALSNSTYACALAAAFLNSLVTFRLSFLA